METTLRLFVRDTVEAFIPLVAAITFFIPSSEDEAIKLVTAVTVAFVTALLAAARRDLLPLLLNKINPPPPGG